MPILNIFPDAKSLVSGAAEFIATAAAVAIKQYGRFTMALSGGSTPKPVYELLATPAYRDRLDWSRVQIFFGDERCVPPDDPKSNFLMAKTALLDQVPLPSGNVYRMHGEDIPERAAVAYAKELQDTFGGDAAVGGRPPEGFDLILLGLGDNGHTASLFPGLAGVTEEKRWVLAQYVEVVGMWRLTLTPVVINAARQVAFLVSGANKAEVVQQVLEGPHRPVVLPAQSIQPDTGELRWLLDAAAAGKLGQKE
jgi:6-phosphogluconolactonase